jgi:hypothetical protein
LWVAVMIERHGVVTSREMMVVLLLLHVMSVAVGVRQSDDLVAEGEALRQRKLLFLVVDFGGQRACNGESSGKIQRAILDFTPGPQG